MSSRDQKITKNITRILKFYKKAIKIPIINNKKSTYGKKQILEYAKKLNLNEDKTRKARQLANTFTRDEIESLCKEIQTVQSKLESEKRPFTLSHLLRSLTVPERSNRWTFIRKTIKEGWSVRKLNEEIAREFGTRRQGGRKGRIPKDPGSFLKQLERSCQTWRRWFHEVSKPEDQIEGEHCTLEDLPQTIKTQVKQLGTLMDQLHSAIEEELREANPMRSTRSRPV